MRWIVTILIVASVAGCWNLANGPAGTGGTTDDAGAQCSATTTDCASCTTCALSSPCASLNATCQADPDCVAIDLCVGNCADGDLTCQQSCEQQNPYGVSDFEAVWSCLQCDQCAICGKCG